MNRKMQSIALIDRRKFLKVATATGCASVVGAALGLPTDSERSDAYRLVAASDRRRILAAASKYVSQAPSTITSYPASRSAGGLHDFYSEADYFWPNPKDPNGPYINRDGQSNPENFDEHRKVLVALSIQMPALTAAWLLTGERRFGQRACDHLRAWVCYGLKRG